MPVMLQGDLMDRLQSDGRRSQSLALWTAMALLLLGIVIFATLLLRGRDSAGGGGTASAPDKPQAAASGPGPYRSDSGPYKVSQFEFELHDSERGKDLPLRVYYPDGIAAEAHVLSAPPAGPYPVIVFSHGAGGSRDVAPALLCYWAGYGYVVFAPTHEDSIAAQRAAGKDVGMNDVLGRFGKDPELRIGRVQDDRLVIDSLDAIAAAHPELAGKLDAEHVGVGGHSAGAMTAVLIGGAIMDMSVNGKGGPETEGLKDPRVAATLLLSGQGMSRGPLGTALGAVQEDTWRDCNGPMMVMTGSLDSSSRTGQTAESRKDPYIYAPPGDKYLLFIEGAVHMSFTGKAAGKEGKDRGELIDKVLGNPEAGEASDYDQTAIFSYVQYNSLAFWDAYLKGDNSAMAWLQSQAPAAASGGAVEYQWK